MRVGTLATDAAVFVLVSAFFFFDSYRSLNQKGAPPRPAGLRSFQGTVLRMLFCKNSPVGSSAFDGSTSTCGFLSASSAWSSSCINLKVAKTTPFGSYMLLCSCLSPPAVAGGTWWRIHTVEPIPRFPPPGRWKEQESQGLVPVDYLRRRGGPAHAQPDPAGVGSVREVKPRLPGRRSQVKACLDVGDAVVALLSALSSWLPLFSEMAHGPAGTTVEGKAVQYLLRSEERPKFERGQSSISFFSLVEQKKGAEPWQYVD